jgi:hypothetical protein
MGPIYGTIFMEMSDKADDADDITLELFGEMLQAGLEGLYGIVDARPGDKTLVDTLFPACECIKAAAAAGKDYAEALDEMGIVIDKVIDIEVADDVIVNRLSGRRVCEKCGRPYHTESLKPKVEGICDDCAGALIQRKDDHPDTVKARLDIYHKETEPLKGYYEKQGKLYVVEGASSVEETTRLTFEALEA